MITPDSPKKNEPLKLGQKSGPTLGAPTGPTLKSTGGPTLKPGGGPAPTIQPKAPAVVPASPGINIPRKVEAAPAAAEPVGDLDLAIEDSVDDIPHDVVHEPGEDPHTADEIAAEHAPDHQQVVAPPVENFDPPWVNKNAPKEDDKPRVKVDFENLPEFVAQREMLRKVRIGAIIGGVIIVFLIIWFVMKTGEGLTEGVKSDGAKTEEK